MSEFYYQVPVSYEIKKRTFEGETDPTKNFDPLTSKYMRSYKYWIEVTFKNGTKSQETFSTKRNCIDYYERRCLIAGKRI